MNTKSIVSLVLRILVGALFIMWGIGKLGAVPAENIAMIWWAFHNLGLTFFDAATWTTILWAGELLIWLCLVLGLMTRTAAVFAIIILIGAMNTLGWATSGEYNIWMPLALAIASAIIIWLTAGQYSLDFRCCKGGSCCGWLCGTTWGGKYKGKEVVEA